MSLSVIVLCFNQKEYIVDAIQSVARQNAFDEIAEIIVVDDGSTDGSAEVVDGLTNDIPRFKVFHIENCGISSARNFGIGKARGALIAFLDGDDYWVPEKLERQLPAIKSDEKVGLVYSDFMDFTQDDASDARLVTVRRFLPSNDKTLEQYFVHDAPIIPSTVIVRKVAFDEVGLFDPSFVTGEDTEMHLRVAERWKFAHVQGGLTYKRRHGDNATSRLEELLPFIKRQTDRCIERNPELAALAGKRMARRYARIGNDCVVHGERRKGHSYLIKAMRLDPLFFRTYAYLFLSILQLAFIRRFVGISFHFLVSQWRRIRV